MFEMRVTRIFIPFQGHCPPLADRTFYETVIKKAPSFSSRGFKSLYPRVDSEVHPGCNLSELQRRMNASKAKKEAPKKVFCNDVGLLHPVFPTFNNSSEDTAFNFPVNNFLGML